MTLALLQSIGTSPIFYSLSKMIESGLSVTSVSSLSTHGCILSRPIDLRARQSLNRFALMMSSILQMLFQSRVLDSQGAASEVKNEAKKALSNSIFSVPLLPGHSPQSATDPHFSSLPFAIDTVKEAFLLVLDFLHQM